MDVSVSAPNPRTLLGRWVLPVESPPIPFGKVEISQDKILSVSQQSADEARHCPNIVLLPSFVNAHTHLEFSSLSEPISCDLGFTDWIRKVIFWRRSRDQDAAQGEVSRRAAILSGIKESLDSGTECIGEIATSKTSIEELRKANVLATTFWEIIALSPDRIPVLSDGISEILRQFEGIESPVRFGISPHAPYTVHPDLLAIATRVSRQYQVPLAMHLAESQDELELLRDRTGPLVQLLEELNVWRADAIPPGSRPYDYLQALQPGHRSLIIHGNYLDRNEQSYLAEHRERMSLVYCPRTHTYFGHETYPLDSLISRGIRVALGTDSRASNPDLSMLAELKFLVGKHPDVDPAEALRMATVNGAEALGMADQLGSLQAGKSSRIQCIPLPDDRVADPYSWMHELSS